MLIGRLMWVIINKYQTAVDQFWLTEWQTDAISDWPTANLSPHLGLGPDRVQGQSQGQPTRLKLILNGGQDSQHGKRCVEQFRWTVSVIAKLLYSFDSRCVTLSTDTVRSSHLACGGWCQPMRKHDPKTEQMSAINVPKAELTAHGRGPRPTCDVSTWVLWAVSVSPHTLVANIILQVMSARVSWLYLSVFRKS